MSDIMARILLHAEGGDQVAGEYRKAQRGAEGYQKAAEGAAGVRVTGGVAAQDPFAAATASAREAEVARARKDHQDQMQAAEGRQKDHETRTGAGVAAIRRGAEQIGGIIQGAAGIQGMMSATAQALGTAGGFLGGAGGVAGALGIGAVVAGIALRVGNSLAERHYARIAPMFATGLAQRLGAGDFQSMVSAMYWQGLRTGMPQEMTMRMLAGYSAAGGALQFTGEGRQAIFAGRAGQAFQLAGQAALRIGVEPQTMGQYLGLLQKLGINMLGPAANAQFYAQGLNAFGIPSFGRFVEASTAIIRDMETRMRAADITTAGIQAQERRLAVLGAYGGFTIEGAANIEQRVRAQRLASAGLGRPEDVMAFMVNRRPGEDIVDTMLRMRKPEADYNMFDFIKKTTPDRMFKWRVMHYFNLEPESVEGFIESMNRGPKAAVTGGYAGLPPLGPSYKQALAAIRLRQWDIMGKPEQWATDIKNALLRTVLFEATGIDAYAEYEGFDIMDAKKKAVNKDISTRAQRGRQTEITEATLRDLLTKKGYKPQEIEETLGVIFERARVASGEIAERFQVEYLKEIRDLVKELTEQGKDPKKTQADQK